MLINVLHRLSEFCLFPFSDVNECEDDNGGCGQTCTNTQGSFSCNCQPNHFLSIDGRTCVPFDPLPPFPPPPPPATPPLPSDKPTTTEMQSTTHTTAAPSREPPTASRRQCGEDLKSSSGFLQTMNWPETYPVNIDCEWTIEIPDSDKVIEISFDTSVFGIAGSLPNCEKDWVKIYDGFDLDGALWGPFCHFRIPEPIQTSSFHAKILFHAGPAHSPSRRGFKALYRSVERTSEPQGPRPTQEPPQNPTGKVSIHSTREGVGTSPFCILCSSLVYKN